MRRRTTFIALLLSGCAAANKLTPDQKKQANDQWNAARSGALASLAADQFRDGSFERCEQTLDQALKMTPNDLQLHLLAARLSIEEGQLERAEGHLAKAETIDPKCAEVDYLTGVLLEHWHQPAKAVAAYADAVAKDPKELSYVLAQADMLAALGKDDEALKLLVGKVDAFPHSGVLRDEIGELLMQQHQPEPALPYLRLAATLSPDDTGVREHLAFALLAARQYGEAGDLFERLSKDGDGAKRADFQAAAGECDAQTGRLTDAQHAYTVATQLDAACCGYWLGLAKADAELSDYAAADLAARRAVALDATSNPAACLLGYVRLKRGKTAAALEAFRTAVRLDPSDTVSLCMQGRLLAGLGRPGEAKACYAKARRINPADPLAARLCDAE